MSVHMVVAKESQTCTQMGLSLWSTDIAGKKAQSSWHRLLPLQASSEEVQIVARSQEVLQREPQETAQHPELNH